jgi:hypothetical protein
VQIVNPEVRRHGDFAKQSQFAGRVKYVKLVLTMVYEIFHGWRRRKNKPNQSQFRNVAGGDLTGRHVLAG